MISKLLLIFTLLVSAAAVAEECKLKHLEELEYTDIECQFYMGTAAYRNKVYTVAAAHWNYVIDSPLKYEGEDAIQAMALSTITFLTYQGLGVEQDRNKAVENWKNAVAKGDFEARRHLGFAYSDEKFINKNLVYALGWYESIFLLYPTAGDVDESDLGVYQDAIEGANKLRAGLSKKQKNAAMDFARSTL
ncbi:hypothetical protein [Pseudoalteromonas luteoviolacea]|uniref:hypothetical protein n=1 Tax=Pseudoalteromonas luteoviolacea TaxID=43657 RepID=UPI00114F2E93|nr:hypothetical protein [Pseudoalteromonas luteoviolacea]TQF70722.1 hypothetical protein FLM44_06435 [Pseudoalteromonas luteoviolacea]